VLVLYLWLLSPPGELSSAVLTRPQAGGAVKRRIRLRACGGSSRMIAIVR
jgi:hypothetical protein